MYVIIYVLPGSLLTIITLESIGCSNSQLFNKHPSDFIGKPRLKASIVIPSKL